MPSSALTKLFSFSMLRFWLKTYDLTQLRAAISRTAYSTFPWKMTLQHTSLKKAECLCSQRHNSAHLWHKSDSSSSHNINVPCFLCLHFAGPSINKQESWQIRMLLFWYLVGFSSKDQKLLRICCNLIMTLKPFVKSNCISKYTCKNGALHRLIYLF